MNIDINEKEFAVVKSQVSKAMDAARGVKITSPKELENATELLGKIKSVAKIVANKKKEIVAPINFALKKVRDLFAPVENDCKAAESIIKQAMITYKENEDRIAKEKEDKIGKRVEKGTMKFETGAKKVQEIEKSKIQTKVESKTGQVQFREVRKAVIEDETKLPREYLVPDIVKIRKDALNGVEIEGVKIVVEKEVAASCAK